jgi:protein-S-isoprenylcysteine O-methyltransferase Ste14
MVAVLLNLGRSFSIIPQARALVTTGPYAIVRHPLYLAEEIAIVGAVVQFYSPAALILLAVHIGLQLMRISFEEELLSQAFPDYGSYAGRTPRLIPYFW